MSCPVCGKPVDPAYRPFCSRRCADVDLAHWLRGDYTIPVAEADEMSEDDPQDTAADTPRGPLRGTGRGQTH